MRKVKRENITMLYKSIIKCTKHADMISIALNNFFVKHVCTNIVLKVSSSFGA